MHNNTDCVHRGDEISALKSELAGVVLVFVYVNFLVKQFYTRSRISEHSHPHYSTSLTPCCYIINFIVHV